MTLALLSYYSTAMSCTDMKLIGQQHNINSAYLDRHGDNMHMSFVSA